jgi:hypothetical protein
MAAVSVVFHFCFLCYHQSPLTYFLTFVLFHLLSRESTGGVEYSERGDVVEKVVRIDRPRV